MSYERSYTEWPPIVRAVFIAVVLLTVFPGVGPARSSAFAQSQTQTQEQPTVDAASNDAGERPENSETAFTLYMVGNTGTGNTDATKQTLAALKQRLAAESEKSAVVFLGDQLPAGGLPSSNSPERAEREAQLDLLIEAVSSFPGDVFVIPGETEYGQSSTPLDALLRQEEYLESRMNRGNVFIPDGGFPGPHEVKISDDIRLVALNTQWLLDDHPMPTGDTGDFTARETADVYAELNEIILDRFSDDLIVLGHHPIMSNGKYAGHNSRFYMIPIIGTAAYAVKRMSRNEQYFGGERNEWMREKLFSLFLVMRSSLHIC